MLPRAAPAEPRAPAIPVDKPAVSPVTRTEIVAVAVAALAIFAVVRLGRAVLDRPDRRGVLRLSRQPGPGRRPAVPRLRQLLHARHLLPVRLDLRPVRPDRRADSRPDVGHPGALGGAAVRPHPARRAVAVRLAAVPGHRRRRRRAGLPGAAPVLARDPRHARRRRGAGPSPRRRQPTLDRRGRGAGRPDVRLQAERRGVRGARDRGVPPAGPAVPAGRPAARGGAGRCSRSCSVSPRRCCSGPGSPPASARRSGCRCC